MENTEITIKISDYEKVVRKFAELLTAENEALRNFDIEAVGSLFDAKSKTVSAYRSMVAYFIKNQSELESLEASARAELREISTELEQLLKENEILLKTRMETSQNVMNTIVNIAKVTNNSNATSYGAQGRYSPLDNNKNAIAVNRTL